MKDDPKLQKTIVALICAAILTALTYLAIFKFGSYGLALFILVPYLLGFLPVFINKKYIDKNDKSFKIGYLTLAFYFILLIAAAMEGAICIVIALPLELLLCYLGMKVAEILIDKKIENNSIPIILLFVTPLFSFLEKDAEPSTHTVTSEIVVNKNINDVWEHIIEFPQLKEPEEFIFKSGISYPIHAHIEGKGVGAVRYCTFSTGSFVEPITTWQEPTLLAFDVLEQPKPMTEISWYDLEAPHLDDYFLSKKGEFRMEALNENQTKITGTTWYIHRIKPEWYWQIWSNIIIHKIHDRVLDHIKHNAEQ